MMEPGLVRMRHAYDMSEGGNMGKWIKRIIVGLLIVFVLFFVVGYPAESAAAFNTFFSAVKSAFMRVWDFFASLG